MPCCLRQTMLKLKDGRDYSFRALPFSRRTAKVVGILTGEVPGSQLEALVEALEISLGYDQTPEQVAEILDNGLVPILPGDDDEARDRVMAAMISGGGGG